MKKKIYSIFVSSVAFWRNSERRPPARHVAQTAGLPCRRPPACRAVRAGWQPAVQQTSGLRYRAWSFMIGLMLLLLCANCAIAHDPGLSTATLLWERDHLEVTLVFSMADVRPLVLPTGRTELAAQALIAKFDGQPARPVEAQWHFDNHNNAIFSLVFKHGANSKVFVQSPWLAELPPGHRQLLSLKNARGEVIAEQWLRADSDSVMVEIADANASSRPGTAAFSFINFLALGVKHICTGYDHLLFLFGLLIATRRFVASLKVITCFTLAHSITLAIATFSRVEFPGRIVEPLIAASIVYVGIENLVRRGDPTHRGLLTFVFGLIHGFGFASVLREMGIGTTPGGVALPLFSFNLGVELGQIAVAAIMLPLLWKLKANPAFATRWMPACSVVVALLGGYWLVERLWL